MNPDSGGTWIIFGGTFDPVHRGHLQIAADILESQKADGIMFLPSYIPPHKSQGCFASFDDRMTMLELATSENDKSFVSAIEAERNDENYTINTIRALKARYPKCSFLFLIGADNIPLMSSWYRIDDLLKEVNFLAGSRPGVILDNIPEYLKDKIKIINTTPVDISATEIRKSIAHGLEESDLARLVPSSVAAYIIGMKLYR